MAQHDRGFWADLVAECAAGSAVRDVAERHGVEPRTLSWWRWKFGAEATKRRAARRRKRGELQLLPVEVAVAAPSTADMSSYVEVAVGAAVVRFEVGTDPQYIAALVRGIAPC
jgi:transposase-like protein